MKETDILKKKLNTSVEGLIEMARKQDPFFLARFNEVFPGFYDTLKTKFPQLNLKDFRFCALIRLNLTNQEIVEFENISSRTVENKKYRMKKKLNLSAEDDLYDWIQNLSE
ncbi:LuxR C-terminal-related transcriptional regulator [Chryseobacterium daecheongense]|nr:LuxR C-terminal-related transcriptional regulator [Chryseobacterium daecheongense]